MVGIIPQIPIDAVRKNRCFSDRLRRKGLISFASMSSSLLSLTTFRRGASQTKREARRGSPSEPLKRHFLVAFGEGEAFGSTRMNSKEPSVGTGMNSNRRE